MIASFTRIAAAGLVFLSPGLCAASDAAARRCRVPGMDVALKVESCPDVQKFDLSTPGGKIHVTALFIEVEDGDAFSVQQGDYSDDSDFIGGEKALEGAVNGSNAVVNGKITAKESLLVQGLLARDVVLINEQDDMIARDRFVVRDRKIYIISVTGHLSRGLPKTTNELINSVDFLSMTGGGPTI